MAIIEVNNLMKEYTIVKKQRGLRGAIKGLISPEKTKARGVDGISFSIEQGEIVGYIGPNGAGKSTTIKMLTGILHPTLGDIRVCGISPQKDRKAVVSHLGVVFGQRTQLNWDLRLGESFELLKRIYRIDDNLYQNNLELLDNILHINEIINIPVRQLSLGQRMRGDLAAAMLHSPPILFLDEPTIGLDTEAKHAIRNFILDINRTRKVTVILTTHDLDDVSQLCDRLIVINHGRIVEDGPLDTIIEKLAPNRILHVDLKEPHKAEIHPHAKIIKEDGLKIWYEFDKKEISAAQLIGDLTSKLPIQDISVKEPDIEDAIRELYKIKTPVLSPLTT